MWVPSSFCTQTNNRTVLVQWNSRQTAKKEALFVVVLLVQRTDQIEKSHCVLNFLFCNHAQNIVHCIELMAILLLINIALIWVNMVMCALLGTLVPMLPQQRFIICCCRLLPSLFVCPNKSSHWANNRLGPPFFIQYDNDDSYTHISRLTVKFRGFLSRIFKYAIILNFRGNLMRY